MPSLQKSQPMEIHQKIDDAWIVANSDDKNAVWECFNRDDPHNSQAMDRVMLPRGIMVHTAGIVRGFLWGENTKDTDDYYLLADTLYDLCFKRVYARGTTARHIQIFG